MVSPSSNTSFSHGTIFLKRCGGTHHCEVADISKPELITVLQVASSCSSQYLKSVTPAHKIAASRTLSITIASSGSKEILLKGVIVWKLECKLNFEDLPPQVLN